LPIGNGMLAAVLWGGPDEETWSLSDSTYWSGQRERALSESQGKADLERARQFLYSGQYQQCEDFAHDVFRLDKANFGTHLQMVDVKVQYGHSAEDFERELDLESAVVRASYTAHGTRFTRETFVSHPDRILVSRVCSSQPGRLAFTLAVEGRTEEFRSWSEGADSIGFEGRATETLHSDGHCGVYGRGTLKVVVRGGSLRLDEDRIMVAGADEAIIYLSVATDYGQTDDMWMAIPSQQVREADTRDYRSILARHIADYRRLYGRVILDLGPAPEAMVPTARRIALLRDGSDDPNLFALFYQYGRYLLIAGAREDSPLPLHLQGIWNDGEASRMEWSCDYHLDVNTQMNYYPTGSSNLAECDQALVRFLEQLAESGREVAQDFYGCNGWVAHVFTNAWGFAAPGWEISWGMNVSGGLWLASQLREHYEYNMSTAFLAASAYPVLKDAALFFLDYMVVHPVSGWLVSGPSNSPENSFYPDDPENGKHYLSMGPTLDQVLVRDLFEFCLEAAQTLGIDETLQAHLRAALPVLPPLQIGARGQLQEWLEDYPEAMPDHRHLSHLYALYPGSQVTPDGTPELATAARATLDSRRQRSTLEDVEFTMVLFAGCFARLWDGDTAVEYLARLIGRSTYDNLLAYSRAGVAGAGTSVFVIDGNLGGTAAIAEMLLQSNRGIIHLLPALPAAWASGRYAGLRVRGNAEVDVTWSDGQLTAATVKAFSAAPTSVTYGDRTVTLDLEAGMAYVLDAGLRVTAVHPTSSTAQRAPAEG
jgi:hypothetical protein